MRANRTRGAKHTLDAVRLCHRDPSLTDGDTTLPDPAGNRAQRRLAARLARRTPPQETTP